VRARLVRYGTGLGHVIAKVSDRQTAALSHIYSSKTCVLVFLSPVRLGIFIRLLGFSFAVIMSNLISTWAESEIAHRQGNTENQQVIRVMENLFNNETTPSKAADSIAAIYEPRQNTHHSTNFKSLWGIIAAASQTFSGKDSELLAELFIAIKSLPDVTNKHGYVFKSGGGVVWKDTPDWGWIYWEHGLG
jgi:hypothetical protein